MARTKVPGEKVKAEKPGAIRWINKGGTFCTRNRQVVKHGETFSARVEDIPMAFRDVIKPVDPTALPVEVRIEPVPLVFRLRAREGTAFFDIVDGTGKRISEKDLTEQEAKDVLDKLS